MPEYIRAFTGQPSTPGYNVPYSGVIPYSIDVPAGVGVSIEQVIQIDNNYDFAWFATAGQFTTPDWTIQFIYPDGTKQQSAPARGPLVVGQAPFPSSLVPGYLCQRGSKITVTITNRQAGAHTVHLALLGAQIRPQV
jgi:hypothetical protein